MGRLVEQTISSFYNGVSRQPDIVRLPSQVEEGDDALFSVVTGGFEKRPASKIKSVLSDIHPTGNWKVHPMYLTDANRYFLFLNDQGDLAIYEADTGVRQTVRDYGPAVRSYITDADPSSTFTLVTVNNYTFIVNKKIKTAMTAGATTTVVGTVEKFEDLPIVKKQPEAGEIWKVHGSGEQSTDLYYKFNGSNWILTFGPVNTPGDSYPDIGEQDTISGAVWKVSDLPSAPPPPASNGDVWRITTPDTNEVGYYVRWDASLGKWMETYDPTIDNAFDLTTMPHAIVRDETTGDFIFAQVNFKQRGVGDDATNPSPKFVGNAISDVFFHKNRFGIVSEEWVTMSQASDFFNFWKDSATQSLDSDPLDRSAVNNKSTYLNFAVPFRKTVFMTSERTQFELTSDVYMTPKDAAVDLVTEFRASKKCRPVLLGGELYFASESNDRSLVYEYFYDDQTISNTAADVTKHIKDYIPPEITMMTSSPNDGILYAYSNGRPEGIYVYSSYWDGEQKLQSAWGFWNLGTPKVHAMEFMLSDLYLVLVRNGHFTIETISPVRETGPEGIPFDPLLNGRIELSGVYDPQTKRTSFTLPYGQAGDIQAVVGDHPTAPGKTLVLNPINDTTVTVRGDWSGTVIHFGLPYRMRVQLSKIFLKADDNTSIITGRLQLRHMTLYYDETGYFEVIRTAQARQPKRYAMSGRVLGSLANLIGEAPIESGAFRFPVNSRADTVDIEVVNETAYPSVILSGSWTGFFNETSRQDQS